MTTGSPLVALITGAGRGIGRAIALCLGNAGLTLALTARTRAQLDAVADEVRSAGGERPLVQEMDVADPQSIAAGVGRLRATLSRIDILVNNAGIAESAPLQKTSLELWQRHLAINVTAPFLLSQALVPAMVERGWGRVINIASMAGLGGAAYITAYAASKHALVGLTRALAAETAGSGITVNAICPGYVATDIVWNGARRITEKTGKSFDEAVAAFASFNASGTLIAPEAVAAVVLDLCAEDAAGRTGESITLS
jgi:NAD(P)-dependent dehydrogenase (short-subunit alcohol dehydrogenase family)